MALGVYGFGCEDALIHLLNYVWPNVFETSPHVVQAFMSAIEGFRVALGPNKIMQYVMQVGPLVLGQWVAHRGSQPRYRYIYWLCSLLGLRAPERPLFTSSICLFECFRVSTIRLARCAI